MTKRVLKIFFLGIGLVTAAQTSFAHAEIKLGGLWSAQYQKPNTSSADYGLGARLYGNAALGLGDSLRVGAFSFVDFLGNFGQEFFFGPSLAFGKNTFVELGVGYVIGKQNYSSWGGYLLLGANLSKTIFAGLSGLYRDATYAKWSYGPIIGLRFGD